MAMSRSSITLIVLAFALCFTMSIGSYQYFKFVVQWPPAHCRFFKCRYSNPPQIYTIHGLWPSNRSNAIGNKCHGSPFQQPAPPLEANLKISWPNLENTSDLQFWERQWDRHGMCSEPTFTQTQYFTRAHEIWMTDDINVTDILRKVNVLSGTQKEYAEIEYPIELKIQKTPLLRCLNQKNSQSHSQMLHEVVICWDHKAKKMTDCNAAEATCSRKSPIDIL
uniref:Sa-RNase n=1 Tax=Fragaria viridis TaxID=64942 RepID=A0A808U708_FRAVI|nr:Sa-RNase [Fragaria viridis]QYW15020.1 Sb-RNase [Fragaria viridis]